MTIQITRKLYADQEDHGGTIEAALESLKDFGPDAIIVGKDGNEIQTKRSLLSLYMPGIFSPFCTSQTLIFPDFSSTTIKHFLNIINMGNTTFYDPLEKEDLLQFSKIFSLDLSNSTHFDVDRDDEQIQQGVVEELDRENVFNNIPNDERKRKRYISIVCSRCPAKFAKGKDLKNHLKRHCSEESSIIEDASQVYIQKFKNNVKEEPSSISSSFVVFSEEGKNILNNVKEKFDEEPSSFVVFNEEGKKILEKIQDKNLKKVAKIVISENKTENTVKTITKKVVRGIWYLCDQCDYKTKDKDLLKNHIHSIHNGIQYI